MRPRRNRHPEEPASHERWLVSYSDFVTLLFAFFVVLFASSYRDNQKIQALENAQLTIQAGPSAAQQSLDSFHKTVPW